MGTPPGGVRPGVLPLTPGTMDPATLQRSSVKDLLEAYGVSAPHEMPDPNLFVHNPEAFAKHPIIANILERGMGSIANGHPGYNFLSSLQGQLKGNEEYEQQRAAQENAQTMAPLQQATAIQQLQHGQDVHNAATDELDYHKGLLAHYAATDLTKQQRIAATPPRFNPKTGQPSYYKGEDDNGEPIWEKDKDWEEDPRVTVTKAFYKNKLTQLEGKYGSLENVPTDELANIEQEFQTHVSLGKGAASIQNTNTRAAAKAAGGNGANGDPNKLSPRDKAINSQLSKEISNLDSTIRKVSTTDQVPSPDGKGIIIGGSSKHKAYIEDLNRQKQAVVDKQNKLLGVGNQTSAPQYSAGNPFNPDNKK